LLHPTFASSNISYLLLTYYPAAAACARAAELHVYDEKKNYVPFDQAKPEPFFEVQRKVIPNTP
jgi:hypothetical protein